MDTSRKNELLEQLQKEKQKVEKLALDLEMERDVLETIMENTKTHLAYFDKNFNFIKVNLTYIKAVQKSKKEIIGKNYFKLFPNKENQEIFKKVKKTGKKMEFLRKAFVYPGQPERGVSYWDWTLSPVKDDKREIKGFVLSLIDVTGDVEEDKGREILLAQVKNEKEKAKQLAMESEKRAGELDALFMALADALFVYDIEGILISANPAAVKLFGINPVGKNRELIAKKISFRRRDGKLVPLKDLPSSYALSGKIMVGEHFVVTNAQGKDITVLATASPVLSNKEVIGGVVILHDISEKEKIEKQKDDFIALASHELKTPVTTLKAYTQILEKKFSGVKGDESYYYLTKMGTQLNRLTNLVSELLDVTKIESGKLDLKLESIEINSLITEVIEDIQKISPAHQIIKQGSLNVKVLGDKDRLAQVLINLLLNAVKYSPKSNKVIVRLKIKNDKLEIAVQDFGIGIPKQEQRKVFDRFFRVNGLEGERFPGLGLGLYISSEIINRHRGTIGLKSTVGKGSTFFFSLPIKKGFLKK